MKLYIRKESEGPTALDLQRGDIEFVKDDAHIDSDGGRKFWLIVKTDNYGGDVSELTRAVFEPGPPEAPNTQRHARAYFIPYWEKANPNELKTWDDVNADTGVVVGRFNLLDIVQK